MTNRPVVIVEIVLPFCENDFGVSPCTATVGAGLKCYNTFATCQDEENFTKGEKSYYFTHGDTEQEALAVLDRSAGVTPHVTPSLVSYSTLATKINIAGADDNFGGLGTRAKLTLQFKDHADNDLFTDPYVSERLYSPKSQGTFWTKFLVRNKFRKNAIINVYEGDDGDELGDMTQRTFFWIENSWPSEDGGFSITAKDVLAFIEDKSLQVPALSSGELYRDMTIDTTVFRVQGGALADYDSSGTVRIDDEIMTYSSVSQDGDYLRFAGVTRGTDGTDAAEHDADTRVQRCVRIDPTTVDEAVNILLSESEEGNIPDTYLDTTQWASEVGVTISSYQVSELLSEPTSVTKLIGQIQEQTLTYIWWEERERKVKMRVVTGYDAHPDTITDLSNIMSGFSIEEMPDQRVTQLWYYYDQSDKSLENDDVSGFERGYIRIDADKEGANQYDDVRIRKIYANWIDKKVTAADVSQRYMVRYVDVPRKAVFEMDRKDSDYGVGDVVYIDHWLDTLPDGSRNQSVWLITEYTPVVRSGKVAYTAHDITSYGRLYYYMDSDAANYDPMAERPFNSAYYGDEDGLLSDGTIGATYG